MRRNSLWWFCLPNPWGARTNAVLPSESPAKTVDLTQPGLKHSLYDTLHYMWLHFNQSTNEAVFGLEFNPADSGNIITCGKSHVFFWTWSGGALTKKQGIFGKYRKPKFIQCFVFNGNGDVLTGDSEGNILTWGKSAADIKTLGKGAKETFQIVRQTKAHEGSIFTLCLLQGGALLSGGGKDRRVVRWSADLAPEIEVEGHVDELWGLATHPFDNVFLSCGHDKQVCLWSGSQHSLEWSTTLEETGLCADFHPNGRVVGVGLNTGRLCPSRIPDSMPKNKKLEVVVWTVLRSTTPGVWLEGSDGTDINALCRSHNERVVAVADDFCKVHLFQYPCPKPKVRVWLEGSDGTDINALCRSHNERVVAVADDFCKVHLFQYPCPKPKAPSHRYDGHGSHVTNVRFTHNDSHLISMGGKDTSILQWRVVRVGLDRSRSVSSASISSVETGSCG
ncbi:UNVERIFIED_CONTAM: hypothetical protein FKN15_004327 [Acipenser sinensis]